MKLADSGLTSRLTSSSPVSDRAGSPCSLLSEAIGAATCQLLQVQQAPGNWQAALQSDVRLSSQTLLQATYLGTHDEPLHQTIAQRLLWQQREAGGWSAFPGGPLEISASVQAYFALKLIGIDPDDPQMRRACHTIRAAGGVGQADGLTRFFLALLGQIDYRHCPEIPLSMLLVPTWLPGSLYQVNAPLRALLVPLAVVSACRPVKQLAPHRGIAELFQADVHTWPDRPLLDTGEGEAATRSIWQLDRICQWLQRRATQPFGRTALDAAREWLSAHLGDGDAPAGSAEALLWSRIALRCLKFERSSPENQYCEEQLAALVRSADHATDKVPREVAMSPVPTPVEDTSAGLAALCAVGIQPEQRSLRRAVSWLLECQVTRHGDWARRVDAEPGGWAQQQRNASYPHVIATAQTMTALRAYFGDAVGVTRQRGPAETSKGEDSQIIATAKSVSQDSARRYAVLLDRTAVACERARRWLLAIQNPDGGWATFDRNLSECWTPLEQTIPRALAADPSSPDATGAVLEAFGCWGERQGRPVIDRAVDYLRQTQHARGFWRSRSGVAHLHGTYRALLGLAAVGISAGDAMVDRAADWLAEVQFRSGGWGELPSLCPDASPRMSGPVTATQTAWAILGLCAAGRADAPATKRGIEFLIRHQRRDGTWEEAAHLVAGPVSGGYTRNGFHRLWYPLLALAEWKKRSR